MLVTTRGVGSVATMRVGGSQRNKKRGSHGGDIVSELATVASWLVSGVLCQSWMRGFLLSKSGGSQVHFSGDGNIHD